MFEEAALHERPTKDIADEYDVSAGTVRMSKARVLRRLREVLGNP